jgi:hypothetical protein
MNTVLFEKNARDDSSTRWTDFASHGPGTLNLMEAGRLDPPGPDYWYSGIMMVVVKRYPWWFRLHCSFWKTSI